MFPNHHPVPQHATPQRTLARRAAAALLLAAVSLAPGCSKDDSNAYAPPPPPEVIVANPVEKDVTTYLTYTGTIEASETVDLRARIQGFLESINFQPGQRVKKGDLLFVIDKSQYQAAVDQAKARVVSLQASLEGAVNDAKLARELADQKAGPEIDAIIKAARRDAIAADVVQAQAQLVEAELNLGYCDVTAPIDGRITRNFVDVGNLVGRGEPTLLARIVQSIPCYVPVDVSESDVLRVRRERERNAADADLEPGQISPGVWRPCELSLADQGDFEVKGRVDYVEPELSTETGTLRVRTRFENTNDVLLPGYFARIRFPLTTAKSMLVPDAALLTDQQGRYALIVSAENTVETRRVKIGAIDGSLRVVTEGLKPTDRVIVLGVLKARQGAKVTPKLQEPADAGR